MNIYVSSAELDYILALMGLPMPSGESLGRPGQFTGEMALALRDRLSEMRSPLPTKEEGS